MLSLLVTPLTHPSKSTTVCIFNWGTRGALTFKVNNVREQRTRKLKRTKFSHLFPWLAETKAIG